jgi:hypothetical protein
MDTKQINNPFFYECFIHYVLLCFLLTDNIKKWWIWGFWISPMMYAQNAMVNNEFLGNKWKHVSFFLLFYMFIFYDFIYLSYK